MLTVSSDADSYQSQSDVAADVAIVHNPKISNCYETLLRASLRASQPSAKIDRVTLKITPGSGSDPSNVIGTGTGAVTLTASGKTATVYVDVAFITGHLIEAEVDAESIGQPIPASLQADLVAKVAKRADAS